MIDHLKDKGIRWTVLCDKEIEFPSWVEVIKVNFYPAACGCYCRFNQYLDEVPLDNETQYMFLNDDDFVEDGFFKSGGICNIKDMY